LYGTDDESYINDCFSLAGEYEDKFSNTVEDSEISIINDAGGEYVEVSDDTVELLNYGIEYGDISGGLFDLTIGGVSDLWDFSEIAENLESEDNEADASVIPEASEISAELSHVNYKNIDISGNRVRLLDPESRIDAGGIAKGYIADKMRDFLNEKGITTGVISLGGNVLTLGEKTGDEVYTIGIQKPFAETGTALATIKVKDASVVSSGIYERYYRVDGKLYHHILDTSTGYPVENDLWQVTIISKKSMDGDALSTTCFALGLSDGMELIENTDGIEAIFVTDDGELHLSSGIGTEDGEEASLFLTTDVVE
jgi:thiamine biosynthesis lipoprotein